jgi:hypothetical protein
VASGQVSKRSSGIHSLSGGLHLHR